MDAHALSRKLQALPALAMRRAVLREAICDLPLVEAVGLCGEIVRRGRDGAPWDLALVALNGLLDAGELGYERHGDLYAEARRQGDEALARLLLSAAPLPDGEPLSAAIPGRPDITLGERKTLARNTRTKRELLDRLLRDTDASVITELLQNPRVTEADVVRMAARRPTSPEAQRVIFGSERFITRYAVKRALAFNPYTPSDLAARLTPLLLREDLRELANDPKVGETVRDAARETLKQLG
jgi:hypothetical protein